MNKQKETYYKVAGEAMQTDMFWSSERFAYDYTWLNNGEGDKTFYVVTDRHY